VPIVAVWLVRFTVVPVVVTPMAMYPTVRAAVVSVCEVGTTFIEARGSDVALPLPVTVIVALDETMPLYPCAEAVMLAIPAPTAVTSPVLLTVATPTRFELQVTWVVMSCLVGWDPLPNVPVAVICKLAPPPRVAVSGVTRTESRPELALLQLVRGIARQASKNVPMQKRFNI
jgi:hypothetical protein